MAYHQRRASFVRVTMNAAAEGSVSLVSVRLSANDGVFKCGQHRRMPDWLPLLGSWAVLMTPQFVGPIAMRLPAPVFATQMVHAHRKRTATVMHLVVPTVQRPTTLPTSSDSTDASEPVDPEPNPVAPGSVGLGCAQDSDCAVGLECITAGFPRWILLRARMQCRSLPRRERLLYYRRERANDVFGICESDADCRLGYSCFEPGVCYPDGSNGSGAERCTQGSCPNGEICASSGSCVPMAPDFPAGPVPDCSSAAPTLQTARSMVGTMPAPTWL